MKWLILALLILVAVLTSAIFLKRSPVISAIREAPVQTISTSTIWEETPEYKIKADFPVFGIPQLDAKIRETIDAGIADIKGTDANPSPNNIQNEFVSTFRTPFRSARIISVELILSEYSGGAHSNSSAIGINYDVSTQKFLTLNDALTLTGKTLPQISVLAEQSLKQQFGSIQFPEGVSPTSENFGTFLVEKNDIRFIFQEYQVEAFALGMPEVQIPRVR